MNGPPPLRPDPRPVAVVAAVVTVLGVAGVVPVWPGAPHHVALPPLDLFADVRVLLAEAPSYPSFLAGLLVVVAARSVVLAAMLHSLDRSGLRRAAGVYGMALPLALVAGGLGYASVAVVYSRFLWAGVAVAVVATLALGPGPWRPGVGRARGAGRVGAYLAALLVVSLAAAIGNAAVQLLLVWLSALLTAGTAHWLGRSGGTGRRRPVAGGVAVGVAMIVPLAPPPPLAGRQPVAGTLFVVPGTGGSSGTSTMFRLDPAGLGFDCDRTVYFSYAGPGRGAPQRDARCPIRHGAPYRSADTRRPLGELTRAFRAQYAELEPPVVVAAHSQGGWVAAAGLDDAGVEPPTAVVLLGAFPGHPGGYQLDRHGRGLVGTDLLEALTAGLRATGHTSFDPRSPLARQLLGTRGEIDRLLRRGFGPAGRVVAVTSAFDLPVMADRPVPGIVDLCPLYVDHGDLPRSPTVYAAVRRALAGDDEGGCGWWRRWPARAFTAFGVPPP